MPDPAVHRFGEGRFVSNCPLFPEPACAFTIPLLLPVLALMLPLLLPGLALLVPQLFGPVPSPHLGQDTRD